MKVGEFAAPIAVAAPPGDERLFVAEQDGAIRVLDAAGVLSPTPFLDLTGDVLPGSERGLLGMAFAADFARSGQVFVYLTARRGAGGAAAEGEIQIRRYTVSATDPNRADPATGVVLLRQPHATFPNHNGGGLRIGPDGMVWAGIGDGGGADNTVQVGGQPSAQSLQTLLGKIVRITPDGAPAPGNPFIGAAGGARPEIWAYGLRNPYRFSFDRASGDLVIGDVGQDAREEVDVAPASAGLLPGANWGWPCLEGTRANALCRAPGARPPVFELTHGGDGAISIIGGVVVRDPGLPSLSGRYLFTDLAFDAPRSLLLGAGTATDVRAERGLAASSIVSFDEDGCGRVVMTSLSGPVYRVVDGALSACGTGAPVPVRCTARVRVPRRVRLGRRVAVRIQSLTACTVTARAGSGPRRKVTLVPGARRTLRLKVPRRVGRVVVRVRLSAGGSSRRVVRVLVVRRPRRSSK